MVSNEHIFLFLNTVIISALGVRTRSQFLGAIFSLTPHTEFKYDIGNYIKIVFHSL